MGTSQQDTPTEPLDLSETQNPETTLDGEVAGSVDAKPGTLLPIELSASTDDMCLDATSMILKLETEFSNVREYPMREPYTSKAEMDRRWDELEGLCKTKGTVHQTTKASEFQLYDSPEYYQLNRLTLWMAKNSHKLSDQTYPSGYSRQTNATEEDIS